MVPRAEQTGSFRRRLLQTQCANFPDAPYCCDTYTCTLPIKIQVQVVPLVTVDGCLLGGYTLTPSNVNCECYQQKTVYLCSGVPVDLLGLQTCLLGDYEPLTYNEPYLGGACDNVLNNDPIITGFDGKQVGPPGLAPVALSPRPASCSPAWRRAWEAWPCMGACNMAWPPSQAAPAPACAPRSRLHAVPL